MDQPMDNLTIRGFRSIREMEGLELRDLNVLVGSNGSGKSNFLSFFRMLHAMMDSRLREWVAERGGADVLLTFGSKETPQMESEIHFGDRRYRFHLKATDINSLMFSKEEWGYEFLPGGMVGALEVGHVESKIPEYSEDRSELIRDFLRVMMESWNVYHFQDTGPRVKMKLPCPMYDSQTLHPDASNLSAFLYFCQQYFSKMYRQIVDTIRLALPFFDDFSFQHVSVDKNDLIQWTWHQKGNEYVLSPNQMSDGALRFICLVCALNQPFPPATLIIDEPELGLHPYAITLLASLLRSASKRMQVIAATQSVQLVNQFDVKDLIIVERNADGTSTFRRPDESSLTQWLEDYTLGELWEKNILGGRPPR